MAADRVHSGQVGSHLFAPVAGLGTALLWWRSIFMPKELLALDGIAWVAIICVVAGMGSGGVASLLWKVTSQRLSVSLCGQLIGRQTLFALNIFAFMRVRP